MKSPTAILLEDEPIIAADLRTLLRDLGWQVLWAADNREALALCALRTPDVAVLNFRQPDGTDGMSLAVALRAGFPVKVFFITGGCMADLRASPDFEACCEVLPKPFTHAQFKAVLRRVAPPPIPRAF